MDKKTILIIDDDYTGAKVVKEMLRDKGFDVLYAYNEKEGLQQLESALPDLILLDLVLPDTSGFKIAQEIKTNPKYSQIPIIAI